MLPVVDVDGTDGIDGIDGISPGGVNAGIVPVPPPTPGVGGGIPAVEVLHCSFTSSLWPQLFEYDHVHWYRNTLLSVHTTSSIMIGSVDVGPSRLDHPMRV